VLTVVGKKIEPKSSSFQRRITSIAKLFRARPAWWKESKARCVRRAGVLRVSEHAAGARCALSRARRSVQCPPLEHGKRVKTSRELFRLVLASLKEKIFDEESG